MKNIETKILVINDKERYNWIHFFFRNIVDVNEGGGGFFHE
jgi:hypothetical protein